MFAAPCFAGWMKTFGTCWGNLLALCLFWVQAEVTHERLWLSWGSGIIKYSPPKAFFFPAFFITQLFRTIQHHIREGN